MKFALNVISLALGVVVLMVSVQSFSNDRRNLVLDVMANDRSWLQQLNVGIKFKVKNLSAATKEVLLKVIMKSETVIDPDKKQNLEQELKPEHEQAEKFTEDGDQNVVVANALHIVAEVASNYNKHGMALDFALDVIASAIKCNTFMYILVQLKAIKNIKNLQNDVIDSQPLDIFDTLVLVLDKVAVLKESINEEINLYERWEKVISQINNNDLPPGFDNFEKLIEKMLDESCSMNQIEHIEKHIQLNQEENWDTVDKTIKTFNRLQDLLDDMLEDLPIRTLDLSVWESFFQQ